MVEKVQLLSLAHDAGKESATSDHNMQHQTKGEDINLDGQEQGGDMREGVWLSRWGGDSKG